MEEGEEVLDELIQQAPTHTLEIVVDMPSCIGPKT
jgi:hypothetical protein